MNSISIEGNYVNPFSERIRHGVITIEDGVIKKISKSGKSDVRYGDNCLIFSGFGDIHVHLREGQEYKEDFVSGSKAAVNGGVTFLLDQPNNPQPPTDETSYQRKLKKMRDANPLVDIYLYAAVGPGTKPFDSANWYKVYMSESVGSTFFERLEDLDKTLKNYGEKKVSFHCEDYGILKKHERLLEHEDRRPCIAEVRAVENAVRLIKKYKLIGNICHVSTSEGFNEAINNNVSMEVTPHHMFFATNSKNLSRYPELLKMNPPLRGDWHTSYLLNNFRDGEIDFLATDHAPHTLEEKLEKNPSGVPNLDTYGPFVTWLMEKGVSPQTIAKCCSYNPSKFVGRKQGMIKEGYIGSLTILDMKKPIKIKSEMLKTKCGWSPFEGIEFPGRVVATVVEGELYENEFY